MVERVIYLVWLGEDFFGEVRLGWGYCDFLGLEMGYDVLGRE
jgi:hypothetical protein